MAQGKELQSMRLWLTIRPDKRLTKGSTVPKAHKGSKKKKLPKRFPSSQPKKFPKAPCLPGGREGRRPLKAECTGGAEYVGWERKGAGTGGRRPLLLLHDACSMLWSGICNPRVYRPLGVMREREREKA